MNKFQKSKSKFNLKIFKIQIKNFYCLISDNKLLVFFSKKGKKISSIIEKKKENLIICGDGDFIQSLSLPTKKMSGVLT